MPDDNPDIGRASFSIAEFCARNGFSRSKFHALQRAGLAPKVMAMGMTIRISVEAERAWIKAMERRKDVDARRRHARSVKGGAAATCSPHHVSKQGPRKAKATAQAGAGE